MTRINDRIVVHPFGADHLAILDQRTGAEIVLPFADTYPAIEAMLRIIQSGISTGEIDMSSMESILGPMGSEVEDPDDQ